MMATDLTNEQRLNWTGDALMTAWGIIANAWEGDWSQAPDEWRAAAERWRDEDFHPLLDALSVSSLVETEEP